MTTETISMRATFALALVASLASCTTPQCADFEDLTPGAVFHAGDTITSGELSLPVQPFQASPTATPQSVNAVVEQFTQSTGYAIGVELRATSLEMPLGGPVDHVQMHFIWMGGLASIVPNGSIFPWSNILGITGSWTAPGGMIFVDARQYAAPSGELHNWIGTLTVAGPIESLAIGGEELWLDDVCISADDCLDEPVDNGALRFGTLGTAVVHEEKRFAGLLRLGHRAFAMSAVTLPNVSVPAGASLTVTVAVHRSWDVVHPLVSATTTVSGALSGAPVTVPIAFTFPQNDVAATPPPETYAIHVYARADGADATIETVAPVSFPSCESTGRFAFYRAQRAEGTGYAFTISDAFHFQLVGACQ